MRRLRSTRVDRTPGQNLAPDSFHRCRSQIIASKSSCVEAACAREESVMEQEIAIGAIVHRNARPAWDDLPEWRALHRRLREYSRHRAALDAAEAFGLL